MPLYRGPWKRDNQVTFYVSVAFPSSESAKNPLYINSFETDLPIFTHKVLDLDKAISFGRLSLQTSNAKITAEVGTSYFYQTKANFLLLCL